MKIGIDLDGVLTDIEKFQIDDGSAFFIKERNKHLENAKGYTTSEIFEVVDEEEGAFWLKATYYFKEPPRKFASEVVNLLKKEGHEIYIITNRVADLTYSTIPKEQMKKIVEKWLKKHKIKFDKLVFSSGTKVKEIKENNIDIMIEDSPQKTLEISKHCKVFCYDARYNSQIKNNKNITRVFSWYDIYDKINMIK